MSYGLKFKDVKIELPFNSKIGEWIFTCYKIRNWYYDEDTNMDMIKQSLPNQLLPLLESDNWVVQLPSYIYNEKDKFELESESIVIGNKTLYTLNFTTSFKNNKDNALQQFLILIQVYIKEGDIFLCIDGMVSKINYKEKFTCGLFLNGGIKVEFPTYDVKEMSDDAYSDMQFEFK